MREILTIIGLQGKPPRHPANPAIFLAFLFFFILGKSMYIGGFGKPYCLLITARAPEAAF